MRTGASSDPSARLEALIPVVSLERQKLVAEFLAEADLNTLMHLARKGTPENSLRALTSNLAYLEAWCLVATGAALPWPASEGLALKFVAQHLYDAAERARDPGHGMPTNHQLLDLQHFRSVPRWMPVTVNGTGSYSRGINLHCPTGESELTVWNVADSCGSSREVQNELSHSGLPAGKTWN